MSTNATTSKNFDADAFKTVLAFMERLRATPMIYGIAMSPAAHNRLQRAGKATPPTTSLGSIPIIIDPRLKEDDKAQTFHDETAWRARCIEQRHFDATSIPCPNDTNGDGDCGRRTCPICNPHPAK